MSIGRADWIRVRERRPLRDDGDRGGRGLARREQERGESATPEMVKGTRLGFLRARQKQIKPGPFYLFFTTILEASFHKASSRWLPRAHSHPSPNHEDLLRIYENQKAHSAHSEPEQKAGFGAGNSSDRLP